MIFIKLQKYLQQLGYSRRKADEIVFNGKVMVNDKKVIEPWYNVKEGDKITIGEKTQIVKLKEEFVYYVLNKPKGYVSSLYDPKEKNTLKKLIKNIKEPVKPAGRLDKDVTGVLILTNDGDLINVLTSARYEVEKVYIAKVKGRVKKTELSKLKNGVVEEGDYLVCKDVSIIEMGFDYTILKIVMIKGKKHEVKRLFKHIGHEVVELRRISHGPVNVSLVPNPGQIRKIEGRVLKELLKLKKLKIKKNQKNS
ncbi:ribosomal large subunit pseudouridine synthase B [Thermosipho africanus H17ap60334]|uniref:pseudouridine synthase n=1 Tax=Thermosipho africanus TaxID=2421 RepID=UPI00028DA7B7|nr:pseudouridine synthase [Thermosipho africanus]EKF48586.1 ribosomal large subunit pseudouridine synthase B [Thermosipho africanus H17ap60334]